MSLSDKGHPPQGKLGTGSLRAPWLPGKVCNCPAGVRKTLPIIPFLTPRADTPAQHPGSSQHPKPCTAPKTPHGVPRLHTAPEIPRNTSQTTFNIRDLTQYPRPAQHPGSGRGPAGWKQTLGLWLAWLRASVDTSQPEGPQDPGERQWAERQDPANSVPIQIPCKDRALDFIKPRTFKFQFHHRPSAMALLEPRTTG